MKGEKRRVLVRRLARESSCSSNVNCADHLRIGIGVQSTGEMIVTAAQRRGSYLEGLDWSGTGLDGGRDLNSSYVMQNSDEARHGLPSRSRSRRRDTSRPLRSHHVQVPQTLVRPATAPATDHAVVPPGRPKSRLHTRPASRALKTSPSAPTMVQQSTTLPRRSHYEQKDLTALPQIPDQAIPARSSSLQRHARPQSVDRPKSAKDNVKSSPNLQPPSPADGILHARSNTNPGDRGASPTPTTSASPVHWQAPAVSSHRTPRHVPLAPNDPSPLNPLYHITSPDLSSRTSTMSAASTTSPTQQSDARTNDNVLLPPGFKPGSSAHTEIDTIFHPAVTQEVIKEHTVEIIQEDVTREIHVHHYYTYIQPIRVVEILPARHFLVDPRTGQKVEIPAPEGWLMPTDMRPTQPDTRDLTPSTRHYLVDEDHPQGVMEPPPSNVEKKSPQVVKAIARASHKAKWSPFPKIV